jgi:hypothetical protein
MLTFTLFDFEGPVTEGPCIYAAVDPRKQARKIHPIIMKAAQTRSNISPNFSIGSEI